MYENRKAFRTMIAMSEGTANHALTRDDGYDVVVTGIELGPDGITWRRTPEVFTDYSHHPFAAVSASEPERPPKVINRAGLASTASGRYQILRRFWLAYAKQLGLRDFGRSAQDAYVDQQLRERSALPLIDGGYIDAAIRAVSGLWASMPGKAYDGQTQHTFEVCRQFYLQAGGMIHSP